MGRKVSDGNQEEMRPELPENRGMDFEGVFRTTQKNPLQLRKYPDVAEKKDLSPNFKDDTCCNLL